jgi:hypothetical protein
MSPSLEGNETFQRIKEGNIMSGLPEDLLDAPSRVGKAEDPIKAVAEQLRKMQDLL